MSVETIEGALKRLTLDGCVTWEAATEEAKKRGKRLLTSWEVQNYLQAEHGHRFAPLTPVDMWVPVSDSPNDWVSVGGAFPDRLGKTHKEVTGLKPDWGDDSREQPWRGLLLLFDVESDEESTEGWLQHLTLDGRMTWDAANEEAKKEGKRLPTQAEVAAHIESAYEHEPLTPVDMWVPVSDSPNEWVSVGGAHPDRLGKNHTEVAGSKPGWGQDSSEQPWRGLLLLFEE